MRILLAVLLACTAAAQERLPIADPSARRLIASETKPRDEPVRLIVRFRRGDAIGARVQQLRRDIGRAGGIKALAAGEERVRVLHQYSRVLFGASVRVQPGLRDAIAALPYVASVQEDRQMSALLAGSVGHIGADKVWSQFGTRGAGVRVAVIDSGIDYMHPALGGGIGSGFKVEGGWDFVESDADPMDVFGHGTHVAGIIAANGGGLTGVAPEATLIAYRALAGQHGYGSDVIAAIERSVDPDQDGDPSDRVDIVNMSLGGEAVPDDPVAAAVEQATAAGILFVIAAGNGGDYGRLHSPGIAPSAITVGASSLSDRVAGFSSRGPAFDYGIKPEVVAPGVAISSAVPNGKIAAFDGTSMATPHVAGVAALLKGVHPRWTPAELKSAIVSTAAPLGEEVMTAGAGRVDAHAATSTATLLSAPVVDFGRVNPRQETWSRSRSVVLRNISASPQTLTAAVHGAREGVTVRVEPQSVTLAPGASATVEIGVTVTNALVPAPREGSLSFGGRVEWSGGPVPVRVPWAFVKGSFIHIDVRDASNDAWAMILGERHRYDLLVQMDARVLWPLETVDIVVREQGSFSRGTPNRIFVAERVDLTGDPYVPMLAASAQHTIALAASDEKGNALIADGRQCLESLVLAFPTGRKVSFLQAPASRDLYASFSGRVRFHPMSSCAEVPRSTVYAALHEPMNGLSASVTNTLIPRWLRQDLRFEALEATHLTGVAPAMLFPGPRETFYYPGASAFLMRPTPDTLTMYYTPSPSPEVELLANLERSGKCFVESMGHDVECPLYTDAWMYLKEGDVRVEGDLYFEVSPMAYRVPPGTTVTVGAAPVVPLLNFMVGPGFWSAGGNWFGPAGERRENDNRNSRTVVRDASGRVRGEGLYAATAYETLGREVYSIESTNTRYTIAGMRGRATATSWVDLAKDDPLHPLFTSLRITDGAGEQASVIARGDSATLRFGVADTYSEPPFTLRAPPREEATRVEYRLAGTTEWKPLLVSVDARHFENSRILNPGLGTIFRVDLSPVTREHSGSVALRIHAEDQAGNVSEVVLEPAFFVRGSARRRSARN
ncbi:MAG TPA: S8 family serine peptidase [Thermoanaerobaculia bacterium]|nr:S8 family serine peptidase [Thermoanaerobaculia bacterium]